MLLLVLVVLTGVGALLLGPGLLAGRPWSRASPRLGLLGHQAVLACVLGSVLVVAGMAVVSVQHLHLDLTHLLHACATAVWRGLPQPDVALTSAAGAVALLGTARLVWVAALRTAELTRIQRRQREGLALVATCGPPGALVLNADQPFAYCVPGDGGRVVVSSCARRLLDDGQLAAVVAHERAHLRGRHHLLVLLTQVAAGAVPFRPLRRIRDEVTTLVEMAADDRACRSTSREALLTALVALAVPGHKTPGLAMDGGLVALRALRLTSPAAVAGPARHLSVVATCATLASAPWLLGAVPLLLALTGHCDG